MLKADNLPPSCAVVTKSGNLNFLEPSGPVMGLLYLYITYQHQLHVSAIAPVAIFRLDAILSEKLYRYDITQIIY